MKNSVRRAAWVAALSMMLIGSSLAQSPRQRILLDAGWRFQLHDPSDAGTDVTSYPEISNLAKLQAADVNTESQLEQTRPDPVATHAGEKVSFVQPGFNDSAWRSVDLPHDWAVELPFDQTNNKGHGYKALNGNSIGWYRHSFNLPVSDAGKTLWLEFDGIYRNALVWLNGHIVGRDVSGYSSIFFDITKLANIGGNNVLVVRVDATRFEGWFYEGAGIYRHVWLEKTDPVHVDHWGTFVTSTVSGSNADVNIQTEVRNDSGSSVTCTLLSAIVDANGNTVGSASQPVTVNSGQVSTVNQGITLSSVSLWSPSTPYLYKVVSTITNQNAIADVYETSFGVRTVSFDANNGFFLNGKRFPLWGVADHQDHAGVGIARPDRIQYFRIEKLKEIGVNALRTAHNPPAPELLDAADKLGMLVMDENRRFGQDNETLGQLERNIRRDRNHPSIFIWSLANEETLQGTTTGAQIVAKMQNLAHQLDPTRKCTAAMNGGWGSGISTVIDVQGFNYHEGNMGTFHTNFPTQPTVSTEDGSGFATRGVYISNAANVSIDDYADQKASWGQTSEVMLQFYSAHLWNAGSFNWTGFDYRGEPTPYSWPAISSQFGLLDTCGFQKNASYLLQANWTNKTVLHIFPHWNWAGKEGTAINVRAFTNCGDHVELFLNGASQGRLAANTMGHEEWNVLYAAGTLEARCYRNGQVTAATTVATTGNPAAVSLQPDRTTINADGQDVSIVTVAVVDSNGVTVPTATNLISFSVTGGKIIGVGNGDPGSHEADKGTSRSVFNGLAQVLVQSTPQAGPITLKATSSGLTSATANITAQAAATPDFSISAAPSSQTIVAGASTSYTAAVAPSGGFSGTVNLGVSGLPSGSTGTFNPPSLGSGSGTSTLSVSTSASTPSGAYTLGVSGTSGSLSHTATVSLAVSNTPPDFSLAASPSAQTVNAGNGASYTTTVGALNGFSGSVSFAVSGLPAGASGSFNPTSVSGSGNSTLSVSTASSNPAGTSTLTITGTSGSLSHTAAVQLTINAASNCTTTGATGTWNNTAFPSHTGSFTATFDATPSVSGQSSAVGFSQGAQTAYSGFANIVAFAASGVIQARNGSSYVNSTVSYSGGVSYHFRLVINVTAHTYSIFVTPAGGSEQTVGSNFAFRTEQNTVTGLDHWGSLVNATPGGTLKVCNFTVQ